MAVTSNPARETDNGNAVNVTEHPFTKHLSRAIPIHAHWDQGGDFSLSPAERRRSIRWSWSTRSGMWSVSTGPLDDDKPNPRITVTSGDGNRVTLDAADAAETVILLRGLGALPHLGDLSPADLGRRAAADQFAGTAVRAFADLICPFLPGSAFIVERRPSSDDKKVTVTPWNFPPTTVDKLFGSFAETVLAEPEWSARWTTPAGTFRVEVPPGSPGRRTVKVVLPNGIWRFDDLNPWPVVSLLRGVRAIPAGDPGMAAKTAAAVNLTAAEPVRETAEQRRCRSLIRKRAALLSDAMRELAVNDVLTVTAAAMRAAEVWTDDKNYGECGEPR